MKTPWVGIALDGTLAHYEGWQGIEHIGEPVPEMLARVKAFLAKGMKVKIFTARASEPDEPTRKAVISFIEEWCEKHIGQKLEVTCQKDMAMIDLYDDRCHRVKSNTGEVVNEGGVTDNLIHKIFKNIADRGVQHLVDHYGDLDLRTVQTNLRLDFSVEIRFEREGKRKKILFGMPICVSGVEEGEVISWGYRLRDVAAKKMEFDPKYIVDA